MSRKPENAPAPAEFAAPNADAFEAALLARHAVPQADGAPRMAAMPNLADLAKQAARYAKLAPKVLAALSLFGAPIPANAGAIVNLVVELADAFGGDDDAPDLRSAVPGGVVPDVESPPAHAGQSVIVS